MGRKNRLQKGGVAMKKKLLFGLPAFLLALGIMLADCQAAPNVKYLKFGSCTAMTGPAAIYGIQYNRGRQIALEEINEAGGFTVDGQTYKWELIIKDHKYSGPEAVVQTNNLIFKEKVNFIQVMGGAVATNVAPIVTKAQIVALFNASCGIEVYNPSNPLIFKNSPIPSYYLVQATFKYFVDKLKVKSAYQLGTDDDNGYEVARAVEHWGPKLGMDVKCAYYKRGTADYYPLLTKVLADKPDLISTILASPGDCVNICKQARELGYKGPIISWCAEVDILLKELGPEKAENIYILSTWAQLSPRHQAFKNKYVAKWGEKEWAAASLIHYGQFYFMADAIKKAGSLDPWKIAEVLEDMVWDDPHIGKSWYISKAGPEDFKIKRVRIHSTPFGVIQGGRGVALPDLSPLYEFHPGAHLKGPNK
jgi:branched-chain amino acid transport system substrate-binding protein